MKVEEEKSETEKSEQKGRKRRKKDGNQAENMWKKSYRSLLLYKLAFKNTTKQNHRDFNGDTVHG